MLISHPSPREIIHRVIGNKSPVIRLRRIPHKAGIVAKTLDFEVLAAGRIGIDICNYGIIVKHRSSDQAAQIESGKLSASAAFRRNFLRLFISAHDTNIARVINMLLIAGLRIAANAGMIVL